jgi:hypothetical protein
MNDVSPLYRLDSMHNGVKNYFDGKFFLAPLDNPQTILDIGYVLWRLAFISGTSVPTRY